VTHELLSSNLSATLFALGALVMAGVPADDPAFAKARTFVERCQNDPGDGGFIFTPANDIQNKAGPAVAGGFRSYGTMTADGVRALFLLGLPPDSPRLNAAQAWLTKRWDPALPAGQFPEGAQWQRDGAYYYWAWTSAHALHALGAGGSWAERLVTELLKRQGADGAWRNEFTSMREDDPLVATPMAMAGLGLARMRLTGVRRTSIPMH
jgi:squalene-hopene/tetraprenyl-beta-curcumene cyclase